MPAQLNPDQMVELRGRLMLARESFETVRGMLNGSVFELIESLFLKHSSASDFFRNLDEFFKPIHVVCGILLSLRSAGYHEAVRELLAALRSKEYQLPFELPPADETPV